MAKFKRKRRAKNKIEGSGEGALIKIDADPFPEAPAQVYRSRTVTIHRSTLFTAEFEAVIEIIAIDRVYRSMLDRLGRRLLIAAPGTSIEPTAIAD